jgi:GT2 family glycosyltransferase
MATYGQPESSRVRAVIVNYNSADLSLRCIQSLKTQDYAPFEIIVVDNHSDEQDWSTLQKAADSSVALYRTDSNLGYAGGINAGAKLVTGPSPNYILALNGDIALCSPDSVRMLVRTLQEDSRRVACSPLIHDKDSVAPPRECMQVRRIPGYWTLLVAHSCWLRRTGFGRRIQHRHLYLDRIPLPLGTAIECETINGACFIISTSFLKSIGYMDERTFLYMEEFTLGARIRQHSSTACLCTAVVADHSQGASTGMHGRRRPLHRELQQIRSEAVYLRQYAGVGIMKMGIFSIVRATDLLLKGIVAPFGSGA